MPPADSRPSASDRLRAVVLATLTTVLANHDRVVPLGVRIAMAKAVTDAFIETALPNLQEAAQEPLRLSLEVLADDAEFDAQMEASSLGAPRVRAFLASITDADRAALARVGREHALRIRIADVLRKAAYSCDGDCGTSEVECDAAHPIQVGMWTHGQVTDISASIDAIASVLAAELTGRAAAAPAPPVPVDLEGGPGGGIEGMLSRALLAPRRPVADHLPPAVKRDPDSVTVTIPRRVAAEIAESVRHCIDMYPVDRYWDAVNAVRALDEDTGARLYRECRYAVGSDTEENSYYVRDLKANPHGHGIDSCEKPLKTFPTIGAALAWRDSHTPTSDAEHDAMFPPPRACCPSCNTPCTDSAGACPDHPKECDADDHMEPPTVNGEVL
ncbi:hypothetical protein E6R60_26705 [Streptomyces sp. A0642]|uniref:hypothetical protein n=1 Tax=Streptomyces sp. A0642 TaxID=2563100 RepID=UPI0010A284C4|nr:hypothetical protein [Streptomyces sp. A0642]THA72522.1 hypothetical protein E6R60_26705 [Streptomyces sp. A0642]